VGQAAYKEKAFEKNKTEGWGGNVKQEVEVSRSSKTDLMSGKGRGELPRAVLYAGGKENWCTGRGLKSKKDPT